MARPTSKMITRNWRFMFWSAHANTYFGVSTPVTTPTGHPTARDIEDLEAAMLEGAQERHGKEKVRGLICTGWYPLDDEGDTNVRL